VSKQFIPFQYPWLIPAQPSKEGKNNSAKLSGRNASQFLVVDNSNPKLI
jgi:hypothetical protein